MVYIFVIVKEPEYSEINSSSSSSRSCNSSSSGVIVIARQSICRLSVTFVHHKFSAIFLRHLARWPSVDIQVKFYGDLPILPILSAAEMIVI